MAMKKRTNKRSKGGSRFEQLVAELQQQFDPNAKVTHNGLLTDRLGQQRQFDVVMRGFFSGQPILGIIECKDLRRNVGLEDLEAFITKCGDINANIKVFVSSRGFTKKAIHKARHYGIQTLSLLPDKDSAKRSPVATKWYADLYFWKQILIDMHFVDPPAEQLSYDADQVTIRGKKVIDWFKNYLIQHHSEEASEGWIVNVKGTFSTPQLIRVGDREHLCNGLTFRALRACEHKIKRVGWKGTAFYDWQQQQLKPTPKATLRTEGIPFNFLTWDSRGTEEIDRDSFLYGHFTVYTRSFDYVPDAIDLEAL